MNDDLQLLRDYAACESELAFETLVNRYVNLVYSAALRQVRDTHLAEEITQATFIILARKAGSFRRDVILASWLHRTACFVARDAVKNQLRRARREQEAYMQSAMDESQPALEEAWAQIAPLLDTAIAGLGEKDRSAIVLRFFENQSLSEVGKALGTSEDSARMRVSRALEKLRKFFMKRGVTLSTTTIIAGVVSANTVHAAPVGLAKTISTVAAAKGAVAGASSFTLAKGALKAMAWAKAKTTVAICASVMCAAGISAGIVFAPSNHNREAQRILKRTIENYSRMSSYGSSGIAVQDFNDAAMKPITTTFTMRFDRPDLFRIQYVSEGLSHTNRAIAWSEGHGSYFTNQMIPGQDAIKSIHNGVDGAQDIVGMLGDLAGGAVAVVPSMFFGVPIPDPKSSSAGLLASFDEWLKVRLVKESDDQVGNVDCYVLSAETAGRKAWLWIGKQDFLVHQSRQTVNLRQPDTTDAEIQAMIVGLQGEPPVLVQEMKRRLNAARKKAADTMQEVKVVLFERKGPPKFGLNSLSVTVPAPGHMTYTQTHNDIAVNQKFTAADFVP